MSIPIPIQTSREASIPDRSGNGSPIDNISIPDSAVEMEERNSSLKDPLKQHIPDPKAQKTVMIKLPKLFSSVTAQPAKLNPFWESNIPLEADEWAKK